MSARHFVSIGNEGVKTPSLTTHPSRSAEEKSGPKKVNLGVPSVILPLNHGSFTDVLILGLTVQEKIGLVGWRIKQRQIVCDMDMIINEPITLCKWKIQDEKNEY
ncbi:hypothetical protein V6N13_085630 [Hibiscus sabdariffa]